MAQNMASRTGLTRGNKTSLLPFFITATLVLIQYRQAVPKCSEVCTQNVAVLWQRLKASSCGAFPASTFRRDRASRFVNARIQRCAGGDAPRVRRICVRSADAWRTRRFASMRTTWVGLVAATEKTNKQGRRHTAVRPFCFVSP